MKRTNWRRVFAALLTISIATLGVAGSQALAQLDNGVDDLGLFELDASGSILASGGPDNAAMDDSLNTCSVTTSTICALDADCPAGEYCETSPDDWETHYVQCDLNGECPSGASFEFTGIVDDYHPDKPDSELGTVDGSVFASGNSKDDHDISRWKWTAGSSQPKSEITDAFAAAYKCPFGADATRETDGCQPGDVIVYFGMDRLGTRGDAFAGFWWTQQVIRQIVGGTKGAKGRFGGVHQDGDLLMVVNTPQADGTEPELFVFEWCAGCGTDGNDNLRRITPLSGKTSTQCGLPDVDPRFCVDINADNEDSPWPYQSRSNKVAPDTFPPQSFISGGINLTWALNEDEVCVNTFVAETRSSRSIDSSLSDFMLGSFETCATIKATKVTDPSPSESMFPFDFEDANGSPLNAIAVVNSDPANEIICDDNPADGEPDAGCTLTGVMIADGETIQVTSLLPGTYKVIETDSSGWLLANITCTDSLGDNSSGDVATGTATFVVETREDVECVFTNVQLGTVKIEKMTIGGADSFDFTTTNLGGAFQLATARAEVFVSTEIIDVVPNAGPNAATTDSYAVAESPKEGWAAGPVVCDDNPTDGSGHTPSTAADIRVSPGETVTCRFVNVKPGTLTIAKTTIGGTGGFDFTTTNLGGNYRMSTAQENVAVSHTIQGVVPNAGPYAGTSDTYAVAETAQTGWDLASASCDDTGLTPSSVSDIKVSPGEAVTCSFVNVKRGAVVVEKETIGGAGGFDFTSTNLGGGFSITTSQENATESVTIANVVPNAGDHAGTSDTYAVAETAQTGWDLTNAICDDDGITPSTVGDIKVSPGETVTCQFKNTKRGTLRIIKRYTGISFFDGEEATFGYRTNDPPGPNATTLPGRFDLKAKVNDPLPSETDCLDHPVANGQETDCIDFLDLKPGAYQVTEGDPGVKDDYVFRNLLCIEDKPGGSADGGSTPSSPQNTTTANIDLDPGENVTCTFTNERLGAKGTIIIEKISVEEVGTFSYDGDLGEFDLTTLYPDVAVSRTFNDVGPGLVEVSELAPWIWPGDFRMKSLVCDDPLNDDTIPANGVTQLPDDMTASIMITDGETVACTYTNRPLVITGGCSVGHWRNSKELWDGVGGDDLTPLDDSPLLKTYTTWESLGVATCEGMTFSGPTLGDTIGTPNVSWELFQLTAALLNAAYLVEPPYPIPLDDLLPRIQTACASSLEAVQALAEEVAAFNKDDGIEIICSMP